MSTSINEKKLPIALTVDVCDGSFDQGDRKPRFDTLMGVLPDLFEFLTEFFSGHSSSVKSPVTWFVRADAQVKKSQGSVGALFTGWMDFWREIKSSGGEIGWHPHLFFEDGDSWVPARDGLLLSNLAEQAWNELILEIGADLLPVSSRIGEAMGSNELMQFLDSVNIKIDSSALPKRKRSDPDRWFDWDTTPEQPYHPSIFDYRIPGTSGNRFELLEVPFSVADIRAPYDDPDAKISRYLDLSFDPPAFEAGLTKKIHFVRNIVCVIHPMQASGIEIPSGGLVVGGYDTVRTNLDTIFRLAEGAGFAPTPVTIRDFAH